MAIVATSGDDDEWAEAARRAAEALRPSREALRRIAESVQLPQIDAARQIAESIQLPDIGVASQIAASVQVPQVDVARQIAESVRPRQLDAARQIAESIGASQEALRQIVESIRPSQDAVARLAASIRIDPATVAAVNEKLTAGLDWQAPILAMSGPQIAAAARLAAEDAPDEAADALSRFEAVLSDEAGEQPERPFYDWLLDLAPLARDRVFVAAMTGLVTVLGAVYAEAHIEPPDHVYFAMVVLVAIAGVWAAKDGQD
jgi:hypothetical protein